MEYRNDLGEMAALIGAAGETAAADPSRCLARLTQPVDDPYLMARAACVRKEAAREGAFLDAVRRLAARCGGREGCGACPVQKYCNTYISDAQRARGAGAPRIVDLFCGAGGLSLGFSQEGFSIAFANDIEPCCIDTYAHNHPEVPRRQILLADIHAIAPHITRLIPPGEIDVLVGGPPCQGFSMANRQRLIDDPRNRLYQRYIQALEAIRPRFFVMENVKGMLSLARQVAEDFERAGYTVSAKVLNAKDCGVPQNRERLIFIGNRIGRDNDAVFRRMDAICQALPRPVLADALYGLRPLQASRIKNATSAENDLCGRVIDRSAGQSNRYLDTINQGRRIPFVLNHKARYNNDRDIEIFGRLHPGDRSDDPKIADIMPYARRNHIFKDKYFKLEPDKVCKTITAHMKFDCNMYIHPTQARGLTPREAARVQSYPDDYFFRGPYTKTFMQIGNSVPPLLGRIIARAIREQLQA